MFYTIYKITNLVNDKIYIGKHQTKDLNDDYMGSGKHIKRSIEKYGIKNFKKEILFVFDNELDMNAKEAELVTEEFVKENTNYNLCPGGHGGFGYLNSNGLNRGKWHEENLDSHMKKISNLGNDRKKHLHQKDPEWKKAYSKSLSHAMKKRLEKFGPTFKGKTHTEEWKQNHSKIMSEKQKGNKNSQYGTIWVTNGTESKKIKKEDVIPEGWYRGRRKPRS